QRRCARDRRAEYADDAHKDRVTRHESLHPRTSTPSIAAHALWQMCREALGYCRGIRIVHCSPDGGRSSVTVHPDSAARMSWIKRVPKPRRAGICTTGPSRSIQRNAIAPSLSRTHDTSTRPCSTERAPYLAAFVLSSWMAADIASVSFGVSATAG